MADEVANPSGAATGEGAPSAAPETHAQAPATGTPAEGAPQLGDDTKPREERLLARLTRMEREHREVTKKYREVEARAADRDTLAKEAERLREDAAKFERARTAILEKKDMRGAFIELGVDDDDVFYESHENATVELAKGRSRDPKMLELERKQKELDAKLRAAEEADQQRKIQAAIASIDSDARRTIAGDLDRFELTHGALSVPGFDLVREVVALQHGWREQNGEDLSLEQALDKIETFLDDVNTQAIDRMVTSKKLSSKVRAKIAALVDNETTASSEAGKNPTDRAAEKTDARAAKASTKTLTNASSSAPTIPDEEWDRLSPKERVKRAAALVRLK